MIYYKQYLMMGVMMVLSIMSVKAQNPIITDQFSADPTARVFGDKVYLYPSHDIIAKKSQGRAGWFCMEDYHVFSSVNLTDWNDHGVIVSQNKVKWVDTTTYSMWAPDCVYKNGKYYFYFPANHKDTTNGKGFSIGIAIADHPTGPYIPEPTPIKNIRGIDPCVFIDKDGQAYIFWSQRNIYMAKLKESMTELASEPQIIANLPEIGLKEGPFVFERNNIYYLTYPHVQNKTERLEYAIGDNPMGLFKVTGVIMDESPTGCWTNHQSFIHFKGQWYLFYHHNDYSPKFDKSRSVRIDSMFFNNDGTIQKVNPTLRGVGQTDASKKIQLDRYSLISNRVASIAFLDTLNVFEGWKTILEAKDAWIQYNAVDFGKKNLKKIEIRTASKTGGTLLLRLNNADGPIIAKLSIPKGEAWMNVTSSLSKPLSGIHNIVAQLQDGNIEIDWVNFK